MTLLTNWFFLRFLVNSLWQRDRISINFEYGIFVVEVVLNRICCYGQSHEQDDIGEESAVAFVNIFSSQPPPCNSSIVWTAAPWVVSTVSHFCPSEL